MNEQVKLVLRYYLYSGAISILLCMVIGAAIWLTSLYINISNQTLTIIRIFGLILPMIGLYGDQGWSIKTWGTDAEKTTEKINKILLWLGFAINFFCEVFT